MPVDRSTRTLLAILFLMAALFVAMTRIVESAPAGDWWLPLLLFVIGAGFALSLRYQLGVKQPGAEPDEAEAMDALPGGDVHSYRVTATTVPLPQTMTIRPDPDEAEVQRVVSVEEEGVIPFMGAPADEPETEVVAEGPSQQIPLAKDEDTGKPAPEVNYSAKTEAADADTKTAKKEPPATPPAKSSETESEHNEPEAEVVAATTSAPPQPDEPEQVSEEVASPRVAAQSSGNATTGKPDDLTKVRGIGAKSARALRDAGIDSFQKLANSTSEALLAALEAGSVRLVGEVDTWTQQAAYAARGDWEGLDRFNAEQRDASSD